MRRWFTELERELWAWGEISQEASVGLATLVDGGGEREGALRLARTLPGDGTAWVEHDYLSPREAFVHELWRDATRGRFVNVALDYEAEVPTWAFAGVMTAAPPATMLLGVFDRGGSWKSRRTLLRFRGLSFPRTDESCWPPTVSARWDIDTKLVEVEWPQRPAEPWFAGDPDIEGTIEWNFRPGELPRALVRATAKTPAGVEKIATIRRLLEEKGVRVEP